jgi:hypothetical protein
MALEYTEAQTTAMAGIDEMMDPSNRELIHQLALAYATEPNPNGNQWAGLVGQEIFSVYPDFQLKAKLRNETDDIELHFPRIEETVGVPEQLVSLYQSALSAKRGYRLLALYCVTHSTQTQFESHFANQVEAEWQAATLARAILTFIDQDG